MHKDVSKLIRELVKRGWQLERSSKHIVCFYPGGRFLVLPCSPGGGRWLQNARAEVRRIEREASN